MVLAMAATILVAGCADDGNVAPAATASTDAEITSSGLPEASLMARTVGATDEQKSALLDARAHWSSDSEELPGVRAMNFLAEAATFLEHDQMVSLTKLLAEQRQQLRAQRRAGGERRGPHGQRPRAEWGQGPQVLKWADELQLSEEQKTAILEHHAAMREEMQGLRGQGRGRPDPAAWERMRELQDQNRGWLESLLDEGQLTRLQELREERQDARREGREARREERAAAHLDALQRVLQLSDDQRDAIAGILEEQQQAMAALREQWTSNRGRRNRDQREARPGKIEEIHDATRESISALLTAEQRELFDALEELLPGRPDRPGGRGPGGR
jgi:hypothetical protein